MKSEKNIELLVLGVEKNHLQFNPLIASIAGVIALVNIKQRIEELLLCFFLFVYCLFTIV